LCRTRGFEADVELLASVPGAKSRPALVPKALVAWDVGVAIAPSGLFAMAARVVAHGLSVASARRGAGSILGLAPSLCAGTGRALGFARRVACVGGVVW